jgi:DNA-binding NarL/FixJ family response regulator
MPQRARLNISGTTVNNHVQHILHKLNATLGCRRFAAPSTPA